MKFGGFSRSPAFQGRLGQTRRFNQYLDYSVFSAQSAAGQPRALSKIFFVSTFFVVEIDQHEGLCIGLKAALTAG